jgi:hypothetical protein
MENKRTSGDIGQRRLFEVARRAEVCDHVEDVGEDFVNRSG